MEKRSSGFKRLREFPPICWFLPLHLDFEVDASVNLCLERLNSELNGKKRTTFKYQETTESEVSFKIMRRFDRTFFTCVGTLRQVDASQTLLHADTENSNPKIYLVAAALLSLLFICAGGQQPFAAVLAMLLVIWLGFTCLAWRSYRVQYGFTRELETLFSNPHSIP
ncbi:MAG TPA: hypothetical protein VHD90_27280 [Phototrophicaceae bacterium]|nr:hypothetical protein [Phototrophicaceae bacterium]